MLLSSLSSQPGAKDDNVVSKTACLWAAIRDTHSLHQEGDKSQAEGDDAKAFEAYFRAAKQGNAFSMHNVATYMSEGRGTRKNIWEAYVWNTTAIALTTSKIPGSFVFLDNKLSGQLTRKERIKAKNRSEQLLNQVFANAKCA